MIPKGSILRGAWRLAAVFLLILFLTPVQVAAVGLRHKLAGRLPGVFHRLCARLFGFHIVVRGRPVDVSPVLFVGNHTSYLDIMVLGTLIDGSFIAKSEVATWPLFGMLARLQRTVFIERRARHTANQRDEISARLDAGDRLILFPEGTSNDGTRVLPFKSALFAVAEREVDDVPLTVQPFSLSYTALGGLPLGREWRPLLSWYGEMSLPLHVWRVLTFASVRAEVRFHDPVTIGQYGSRKALAEHCFEVVRQGVANFNAGRNGTATAA
ncbi:MAG: 1-acyl-sn-glycerol-3-phosphate acyltransferase [Alphaproteobacteria bacterium]|nr:1-acyl-sn-glycerol-3-phosphate acyltransferase [Alphaproteobacteria bacterium]